MPFAAKRKKPDLQGGPANFCLTYSRAKTTGQVPAHRCVSLHSLSCQMTGLNLMESNRLNRRRRGVVCRRSLLGNLLGGLASRLASSRGGAARPGTAQLRPALRLAAAPGPARRLTSRRLAGRRLARRGGARLGTAGTQPRQQVALRPAAGGRLTRRRLAGLRLGRRLARRGGARLRTAGTQPGQQVALRLAAGGRLTGRRLTGRRRFTGRRSARQRSARLRTTGPGGIRRQGDAQHRNQDCDANHKGAIHSRILQLTGTVALRDSQ